MKRINLLNQETSNKIAAGEVLERPSSAVKELVENSIDANSKVITIEIEEGGQKLIRVTDDGDGIDPEDIEKAFLPHATSKISSIDDIYAINTLGFRGEALPSISAVSHTILRSRVKEFQGGKEIAISGGIKNYIKDVGCSMGTSIEVRDIFYNVPARQKFLKSSQREAALISDIVNRLALAHSNISFRLVNKGKKVVNTYSTENLFDTIRNIYGKNTSDNIIKFEKHGDVASVYGYVGNAEISRGSRNNQSIFVNKRYIKNRLIATAVENAVKSFLMINKYPFFVLFLDIYPEFIDVNVHPTKSEIKFQNDREIFKLVFDAVHEAIKESFKDNFDFNIENTIDLSKESPLEIKRENIQIPIDLKSHENIRIDEEFKNGPEESVSIFSTNEDNKKISLKDNKDISVSEEVFENKVSSYTSEINNNLSTSNDGDELVKPKFPDLRVIGQYHNTYILAESTEDFYLIDQHAAHEKILFQKYSKEIKEGKVTAQILLTPEVIEMSPEDFIQYIENKDIFSNAGFNIEVFGDNTISIREVPNFLGKPQLKNLFSDMLDNLKNLGSGETYEVKYNKIATIACKAAIKANDYLSLEEMKSLVEQLRYIDEPFNCPHGRPTIIKMTLYEIEKKFKRIQ
ncbi:DNA mismatch repair protein MutL [Clostridium pasteurianum DSM 525 = ATCC 6013]|uniref:DNA mismatch repair protein MutL n=1 Tax=Clostridium pasteurianum DSM 525 = ATCC 6013 TaxID=1262449 RepID=A0A0H3J7Z4_CLOPA|nr:DNA mismatch repair endonuclease MutL [Clostridium pasteurianum]AJA48023.1 DNA mismatch repair protein MutL [Clostridium pasteurianum DSM 525 = ATCC 6013]AJA52011.1 DNA mismatch repair protein MutL [Clostridium pasteurianum DSM 525 = ATCC 6013]AOZ75305.1 DNA mismatch repair protein MutL [Clostridium pasteurianum DSM 525 = ATCC 6013]AOZ79100.1 DNA mismatch repair protein MutL [Clostridium pasteurianum]ELP59925.1 DNA mismatch repair protein [Clostridium pasteurianum DSM 525 = ATCC 6013]